MSCNGMRSQEVTRLLMCDVRLALQHHVYLVFNMGVSRLFPYPNTVT